MAGRQKTQILKIYKKIIFKIFYFHTMIRHSLLFLNIYPRHLHATFLYFFIEDGGKNIQERGKKIRGDILYRLHKSEQWSGLWPGCVLKSKTIVCWSGNEPNSGTDEGEKTNSFVCKYILEPWWHFKNKSLFFFFNYRFS